MSKWWGYLHTEGTLHVKRCFDQRDIDEEYKSPFVSMVAGPWECKNREEALKKLKKTIYYRKKINENPK
jgi:hypothetical protein